MTTKISRKIKQTSAMTANVMSERLRPVGSPRNRVKNLLVTVDALGVDELVAARLEATTTEEVMAKFELAHLDAMLLQSKVRRNIKKVAIREWLQGQTARELGMNADTSIRWSWKAGCSCGCSPAFILSTEVDPRIHGRVDWVMIEAIITE